MATAVQIEVSVDENKVSSSLGKVGTTIKQLQADVTTATKNLADAQLQLGKAAEQGNAQAKAAIAEYEAALQSANEALRAHQSSLSGVTSELSHQVPQYAAASGAVRLLEGNLNNMIRPAERFLATTLGLGPALQAAFPVIGIVAMIPLVEHLLDDFQGLINKAGGFDATLQKMDKDVRDSNLFNFLHPQTSAQGLKNLREVNSQIDSLTLKIKQLQEQEAAADQMGGKEQGALVASIEKRIRDAQEDLNTLNAMEMELSKNSSDVAATEADRRNKEAERAQKEFFTKQQEISDELIALQDKANQAGLTGVQKLAAQENAEIDSVLIRLQKTGATIEQQMRAVGLIDQGVNAQMGDQQTKDQAEFEKLTQQMINESDKQLHEENEQEFKRHGQAVLSEVKQNAKDVEEVQRQFAQQQKTLANDLFATFTDLTSGRIGKLITDGFKRLFANIVANWLMTLDSIRNANLGSGGGASGFFGALLGSFFGIGNGGAGAGAANSPLGLPGVIQNFGDFGTPNAASDLFSLGGQGSVLGFGPTDMLGLGAGIGGPLFGSVPSLSIPTRAAAIAGAGSPAMSSSTAAGMGISALFSKAGLAKLLPGAAILAGLSLGGAVGAGADAIGAAMLLANSGAIGAAIAPILGPIAGGLFAYSLGSKFGPTAGALGGAGLGAATTAGTALLVGASLSPFTLGISALIGGLVGLFGGLFGGGPSKHSLADKYINSNVLPLIQQEVTNYEGFRTDFATAINDLEQLKQSSYDQMRQQFGKDATNDEWNKYIVPAIGTAESRINTDEAERQRRGSLVFGAPQFAEGGIFTGGMMPGGAGFAVLHNFERVMTRAATSMYGPELAAMEASAKAGMKTAGGAIHLHLSVNAMDAGSVRSWLRNGGIQEISSAARGLRLEGKQFG